MPNKLVNIDIKEVSGVDRAANMRKFLLVKRADPLTKDGTPMKTEAGAEFPAAAYAYVPDPEKPSTWKLRLWETPETKVTAKQVGMAVSALGSGFRGQKVQIPDAELAGVKTKVRAAWLKANPNKTADDLPEAIKKSADNTPDESKIHKFFDFCKSFFSGGDGGAQDLNSVLADNQSDEALNQLIWALRDSIDSVVDDDSVQDKTTAVAASLAQFLQQLKDQQVIKSGKKISTARLQALKDAHKAIGDVIAGADESTEPPDNGGVKKNKGGDDNVAISEEVRKGLPKEVQDYLTEVEKKAGQVDDLTKKVTGLEKKLGGNEPPDPPQEDIWKGVNPAIRKQMEGLQKQLTDTQTELKKTQDDQKNKEYIAKAAGLDALSIKADEIGPVMKSLAEKDPENFAKLAGVLTAANEEVKKGALFTEAGRGGNASSGAIEKMDAKVNEIITKDASMTREKAFVKVMHENPELYEEYRKERGEN